MTVTHDTRKVMGVECVVVDHKEWEGDMLIERTYDWFAQDDKGTVWYFGEDTKEYENGEVVSTEGSWEAGVDGANPASASMWVRGKPGTYFGIPGTAFKGTLRELTLCCDEPRDDAGDHDENRVLGY
jgi:hypothetical protein